MNCETILCEMCVIRCKMIIVGFISLVVVNLILRELKN